MLLLFVFSANPVRPCKSYAPLQSQYMEVIGSVYHLHGKVYVICGKMSTCRNQKSLKWFVVRSLSAGKGSPVIDLVRRWREIFDFSTQSQITATQALSFQSHTRKFVFQTVFKKRKKTQILPWITSLIYGIKEFSAYITNSLSNFV